VTFTHRSNFFCDSPEENELVGCNFAAWSTGDDGVLTTSLNVRQKPVVCVLQNLNPIARRILLPERCEDGGDDWLAHLIPSKAFLQIRDLSDTPTLGNNFFKSAQTFDLDDFKELRALEWEKWANANEGLLATLF
jgi:hypothetical protein